MDDIPSTAAARSEQAEPRWPLRKRTDSHPPDKAVGEAPAKPEKPKPTQK